MGKKPAPGNKLGVTPAKLALIGVLSMVLMAVLYLQFGSLTTPAFATAPTSHRPATAAPQSAASQAAAPQAAAPQTSDAKEETLSPLATSSA